MHLSRLIIGFFLIVTFSTLIAADLSDSAIDEQQTDQSLCVQQSISQCLEKCQQSGDSDCEALCEENIKNECRQAGE
ncbi:hypothetical protein [Legionella yabuuchiae]|uniref:hypothetical protein n=1 Tax=Legionella yabuuchiae TaxID=376727 RepID=UPI0010551CC1|nr:hypothetical protein [Legionella yabuuchiae]